MLAGVYGLGYTANAPGTVRQKLFDLLVCAHQQLSPMPVQYQSTFPAYLCIGRQPGVPRSDLFFGPFKNAAIFFT